MLKILLVLSWVTVPLWFATTTQVSPTTGSSVNGYATNTRVAFMADDQEDVPFDDDSQSGSAMNWASKIFLWFIYLMLLIMLLGGTYWSFKAKGFWSWVVCLGAALFLAMLLGRYWGYTTCLIGSLIIFCSAKVVIHSGDWKKKLDDWFGDANSKRLRK